MSEFKNIIIGTGISGLYLAYKIANENTLIIEKNSRFGGKIYTAQYDNESYEAGGARISDQHQLFFNLMSKLNLHDLLIPIDANKHYYLRNTYITNEEDLLKLYGVTKFANTNEIWKYILDKSHETNIDFTSINFITFLHTILDKNTIDLLCDTFGYISEFLESNANTFMNSLRENFNIDENKFYVIKGGLNIIINALVEELNSRGVTFLTNTECRDITVVDNKKTISVNQKDGENIISQRYICENLYVCIPKKDLIKLDYFKQYHHLLDTVTGYPLLRIYAKYPLIDNQVWFKNIPKLITDNPILFMIPYNPNTGLIQISYSDNYFAEFWNNLKDENELRLNLKKYLGQIFPEIEIPEPLWIQKYYWTEGCHCWSPGSNEKILIDKIFNTFAKDNVYIINEAYSRTQGWVNCCLENVEYILDKIKKSKNGGRLTIDSISKRNSIRNAWTIIDNHVYDITDWAKKNPGYLSKISKIFGKDGTEYLKRYKLYDTIIKNIENKKIKYIGPIN